MELGLTTEFRSEKIPRNRFGMLQLFRRRKSSFRVIPKFTEESIPRLGTEWHEKISFTKNPAPANRIDSLFLSKTCFGTEFREFASIFSMERNSEHFSPLRNGSERNPRVFCSAKCFRTEFREFASIFVSWYRIPSILLLCGTVPNGIPKVFCSAEQPEFRRNKPIVPSIPSSA